MTAIINKLKKKALSGEDILNCLDGQTKIIKYNEIFKYNDIESLLYPYNNIVILYETKNNYGHWVCVILHSNNTLEFYDPYGVFIDDQLKFIDRDFAIRSGQNIPYLSILFLNSKYKIITNKKKIQKFDKDNSSCGRHVCLRISLSDLSLKDFQKFMKNDKKINSDDKATFLTNFI